MATTNRNTKLFVNRINKIYSNDYVIINVNYVRGSSKYSTSFSTKN